MKEKDVPVPFLPFKFGLLLTYKLRGIYSFSHFCFVLYLAPERMIPVQGHGLAYVAAVDKGHDISARPQHGLLDLAFPGKKKN